MTNASNGIAVGLTGLDALFADVVTGSAKGEYVCVCVCLRWNERQG